MPSTTFVTPRLLHARLPKTEQQQLFIEQARSQVRGILTQQDPRLLLIVGPCSIHDIRGAKEYGLKLKQLSQAVEASFLIVMRTYIEKPRTALGWKGLIHDPFLDGSHCIERGYEWARELLLYLANLELPVACEFLDPLSALYHGDLITWGCIGARTSSSQIHRQIASDLSMPLAFKNSTDGNIESAVNGCLAASYPHAFLNHNYDGNLAIQNSKGNPDVHVVLRGGENKTNFDPLSIRYTKQLMRRAGLAERILVDCSHDNCQKNHSLQKEAFESVLNQVLEGEAAIRGLMLESYLQAGSQPLTGPLNNLHYGISVTDPCLSWEETEELIWQAHQLLTSAKSRIACGKAL